MVGVEVALSPSGQPTDAAQRYTPASGSCSCTITLSKASAELMPAHTRSSTSATDPGSSSVEEISSSSVRAFCERSQFAVACAASTSTAACEVTATRTSSSSSERRRPEAGSPTEKMPRMWPSECRNGTNSSSSGCQAFGISLAGSLGT